MHEIRIAVLPQEFREQLIGFNEKVRRLEQTRYLNSPATGFSFDKSPTRILSIERVIEEDGGNAVQLHLQTTTSNLKIHCFDLDNIEAFILTYRMLTQNNDRYSISNLIKSYERTYDFFKQWIAHLRNENTLFLSADSAFSFEDMTVSNQALLDTVIYGQLAHSNKKKQSTFRHWTQWPTHENCLWFCFDHVIRLSMQMLQHFRDINAAALMVYFNEPLRDEHIFLRLKEKEILKQDSKFPLYSEK